jgi:hypothetical protein
MQAEVAKRLILAISSGLEIAIDNRNKLIALEKLLENHRAELFREYEVLLADVRRKPPTEISLQGLVKLQELLVQD